jgi:hypothetical protein
MAMNSEMSIIMEDFMDDLTFKDDENNLIESNSDKSYYIGKGEFILKQLRGDKKNYPDNYFHFLSSFLRDFKDLPQDKQKILKETMCIQDIVKVVEKKVIVNQKNKNNKPKLNMGNMKYDDY